MPKFSARVALHNDEGSVWFNPGDVVPEWAEDIVGKHCIVQDAEPDESDALDFTAQTPAPDGSADGENADADSDEGEGDDEDGKDEKADGEPDAPDFTAPVTPRRGRTRKA